MSPRRTTAHQLADALLGARGPLAAFVAARRSQGRSWRLIARDLYEATDSGVDVTEASLRTWFAEELDSTAAAS